MIPCLGGVFPVLPTPFDARGAIDSISFARVIDYLLDCGVDGVVFPGLASEYDCLTLEERLNLIAIVGERARGRAAFVVGASGSSDQESEVLATAGAAAGAVGAMVMTPARLGSDLVGLSDFYTRLGRASGLPLMLQNAPVPMGMGLAVADVLTVLSSTPTVAWVKEENMPCGQRISGLLAAAPPGLAGVFGGAGGRYIIDELARGAVGTMPASELTEMHVALMAAEKAGERVQVRDLYEAMLPVLLMQAIFRWRLTKAVLMRRGIIDSDFVRAQGAEMDEGDQAELSRILERLAPHLPARAPQATVATHG